LALVSVELHGLSVAEENSLLRGLITRAPNLQRLVLGGIANRQWLSQLHRLTKLRELEIADRSGLDAFRILHSVSQSTSLRKLVLYMLPYMIDRTYMKIGWAWLPPNLVEFAIRVMGREDEERVERIEILD
jgi:hypothetical protein